MPAKALKLKHTIKLIEEFNQEISEIETAIQPIMDKINSPITAIPGVNFRMESMIIAEIGDFNNFYSPDKILAFAELSPWAYQSGQLANYPSHMGKRGSRYLKYALYNATKYVCFCFSMKDGIFPHNKFLNKRDMIVIVSQSLNIMIY